MENTPIIKDPWSLLGVERDTPLEDVKRARNTLALASHPDKCPDPAMREEYTARMASINDAFNLATDEAAWSKYKQANQIEDEDEDDIIDSAQQTPEASERVANAQAHEATAAGQSARAKRRANLQTRVDDLGEAAAEGACTAEAKARWEAYYGRQAASNSENPAERVEARVGRDAEVARETREFGASAAVGGAIAQFDDARALVEGGGWTAEALAEEVLLADGLDEGSHKQKKAARRALVGGAAQHVERMRVKYEKEHGAALTNGVSRLRIEAGEADEEMEALEEERRKAARKLETRSGTKQFRVEWAGIHGNDAVPAVRPSPRPLNKKEARMLKKLGRQPW